MCCVVYCSSSSRAYFFLSRGFDLALDDFRGVTCFVKVIHGWNIMHSERSKAEDRR